MSHMQENYEKNVYIEIWYEQILFAAKWDTGNAKNYREPTLTYARAATYNSNEKLHVWVGTDICRNMYVKCTTKVDYDFTNFVVSQGSGHVSNSAHEEQYICALCDKRLKETSNENPVLPYFAK